MRHEPDEVAPPSEPEEPSHEPEPPTADMNDEEISPQGRVFSWMRKERADLWVVGLYAAVVGVFSLVTPIAVQQLVTTLAFGSILQPFVVLAIAVFVLLCAAGALGTMQRWVI